MLQIDFRAFFGEGVVHGTHSPLQTIYYFRFLSLDFAKKKMYLKSRHQ